MKLIEYGKLRSNRLSWSPVMVGLSMLLLCVGGAGAADRYKLVGAPAWGNYFVPVTGWQFPDKGGHTVLLRAVNADQARTEYSSQNEWPISIDTGDATNPLKSTTGTNRIPPSGTVSISPVRAGECRIVITFTKNYDENGQVVEAITVGK